MAGKRWGLAAAAERPRVGRALLELVAAPEEERLDRELAALLDDDAFEELAMAEDELVDAAVRDRLSPGDREFWQRLSTASPRLREHQVLFGLLARRATEDRARSSGRSAAAGGRRWRHGGRELLTAAAALALLAMGAAFLVSLTEPWRADPGELAEATSGGTPRETAAALVLPLGNLRSESLLPLLQRPASTGVLRLHLEVDGEPFTLFRVDLQDAASGRRVAWEGLRPEALADGRAAITLEVPWRDLTPGQHLLTLAGLDEQGRATPIAFHELEVESGSAD
jgi:hypothetical protein